MGTDCKYNGILRPTLAHWIFFAHVLQDIPFIGQLVPGLRKRACEEDGVLIPEHSLQRLIRWGLDVNETALNSGIRKTVGQIASGISTLNLTLTTYNLSQNELLLSQPLFGRTAKMLE